MVNGVPVVPRDVLHALRRTQDHGRPGEPRLRHRPDQGRRRARTAGPPRRSWSSSTAYDEATGFTAMERTTGWDGSIEAIMNAHGVTPRGVKPVEIAVPVALFVAELRRRGFALTERLSLC